MRRGRALPAAMLVTAALAATECETPDGEAISREQFVETYVALRVAELRSPGAVIPDGERERVLAEQEITEDDLVRFAEANGDDVAFMQEVWAEVENRLDELRSRPDTVG